MMKIDADLSTVLWEKDIPEFMELRRVVKAKDGSGYAAVGNMMPAGSEFVNLAMYFTQGLGDNGSAPVGEFQAYGAGDAYDMDVDMDGNYIIGGHTVPINPDGTDGPGGWEGTAIKVNQDSKSVMWLKTLGTQTMAQTQVLSLTSATVWLRCPGVVMRFSCGSGIEPPTQAKTRSTCGVRMWCVLIRAET